MIIKHHFFPFRFPVKIISQNCLSNFHELLKCSVKSTVYFSSQLGTDQMTENQKVDDPFFRHLFDGNTPFNVYKKDIINLSVGAPGPDLLKNCGQMLLKATKHRTEEEEKEGMHYLYQYGITAGLWECRDELAKFLTRRYQDSIAVTRENLVLTCGATHGLQLLLTTILSPNGVIFVEEVTYMIALDAFKQFPLMKIVTVPMKNNIVDLEALDRIIAEEKKNNGEFYVSGEKIFWGMFYTIPTFHNPTGMTLPEVSGSREIHHGMFLVGNFMIYRRDSVMNTYNPHRSQDIRKIKLREIIFSFISDKCKELVEIARKHSIAVACDDVYNLLCYTNGSPPRRLLAYDSPADVNYKGGNVISNGSFSKILSPAIRVGWIEASPRVVNILRSSGILCSGGAVNHYVSGIITSLLQLKLEDEFLDLLIKTNGERLEAICSTLDRYLPRCCSYKRPEGGYFVWIQLPSDCDGREFLSWCSEKYRVSALPGSRFSNTGDAKNYLRLSIAFHQTETLVTATKKMCEGLLEYLRNSSLK